MNTQLNTLMYSFYRNNSLLNKYYSDRTRVKMNIKIGNYEISEPSINEDDWLSIKNEEYLPDKNLFIFEKFAEDYPEIASKIHGDNIDDKANKVYSLASRSAVVAQWLSNANLLYSLDAQTPTYYKEFIDPKDFKEVSVKISTLNKINSDQSNKLALAAKEYQEKIRKIQDEAVNSAKKLVANDRLIRILTVPTTSLPISIQLAIENYTPKDNEAPTQKAYAREYLIAYKTFLLKQLKQDKNFDVEAAIDSLKAV